MRKLRDILYEYANTRGGGLPLTAEEVCNAVTIWVQQYVTEYLSVRSGDSYIKVANDNGTHIITLDLNSMSTYIDNEITLFVREQLDEYVSLENTDGYLSVSKGAYMNYVVNLEEQSIVELISSSVSVYFLNNKIKGSESIIVDIAEDRQTLEVHIDSEVMQKIERAILIPVSPVTENSVPVVSPTNEVSYTPVSELGGGGGGGGGTKLYLHTIGNTVNDKTIQIISTQQTPISTLSGLDSIPTFAVTYLNGNYFAVTYSTGSSGFNLGLYRYYQGGISPTFVEFGVGALVDTVTEL